LEGVISSRGFPSSYGTANSIALAGPYCISISDQRKDFSDLSLGS